MAIALIVLPIFIISLRICGVHSEKTVNPLCRNGFDGFSALFFPHPLGEAPNCPQHLVRQWLQRFCQPKFHGFRSLSKYRCESVLPGVTNPERNFHADTAQRFFWFSLRFGTQSRSALSQSWCIPCGDRDLTAPAHLSVFLWDGEALSDLLQRHGACAPYCRIQNILLQFRPHSTEFDRFLRKYPSFQ